MIVSHSRPFGKSFADTDAEQWVVGSLLIAPRVAAEVFAVTDVGDFVDELAIAAMTAIRRAWLAGEPIDFKLVYAAMRDTGGDVGELAHDYLREISNDIPTAAHARHYAQRVAEAAQKRRLHDLALKLDHDAQNGKASTDILSELLHDASVMIDGRAPAGNAWSTWEASLDDLDRLTYYELGGANNQLNRLCVGPGLITLIGALPGFGKTALAMQVVVDALFGEPDISALVANCEMSSGVLLDRQLARIAQVSYSVIRDRTYRSETLTKVKQKSRLLVSLRDRLHFMGPPFTMPRLRALAASTGAHIVVIDYIQRFRASTDASDQRQQVSDVMSDCREIAMSGPAIIAVSAMSRQGQFRESSECEYGCDTGFVIEDAECRASADYGRPLVARCIKNRHGAMEPIELTFDGRYQEHLAPPEMEEWAGFDDTDGG